MTYDEAQAAYAKEAQAPWYVDSDNVYTGCAMPIGKKAEFWRQYFFINMRERVQYRSLLDHILRDFAEVERQYHDLDLDLNNLQCFCDLVCPRGPWRKRLPHWLKQRWRRVRLRLPTGRK